MERIDKIIASQGKYSRSDVKGLVAKRRVMVDGKVVKSASEKADPVSSRISIDGVEITVKKHVYLMLNKPKGYVSATEDKEHQTVLELVPEDYAGRELFPAGRLDRDTTGLMIITDDGVMAHNILAPKKHVQKVYHVTLDIPVTVEMQKGFADGVELNDGICKAAGLEITGKFDPSRATVKSTSSSDAVVKAPYSSGETIKEYELTMVYENGQWRMDSPTY